MSDILINPNQAYQEMAPELEKMRDTVAGSFFVKQKGVRYLAHPSDVDQTSDAQRARYQRFKQNASFVEVPGQTLKTVVGKLSLDDLTVIMPDELSYLETDVDKDGLSLIGLSESLSSEQVSVKWSLLVSDYQGLTDVDTGNLSASDLEMINPRPTMNQYTRENVVDWAFGRVDGRMQLVYVLLKECAETFDYNNFVSSSDKEEITSYLKLALDEEGDYYQQKLVTGADYKGYQEGERNYPDVGGSYLKFLPVEVVADEEFTGSDMPKPMGYLSGISDLVLERYNNDADYKEVMRNLKATTYITGADNNFAEQFPESNNGRKYISVGGVNVLNGDNIGVNVVSADDHTAAFERYKVQNEKEIRALGGVFPSDELRQRTATETVVEAANMTAMLNPMVSSLEKGLTRSIAYCAMFEGLVEPKDVVKWADDNIAVNLPRNFSSQKMTVEERQQLSMEFNGGIITKETYLMLLEEGGVIPGWEEELAALETAPPRITDV